MDTNRQQAYRHLLYTVLLQLRAGSREVLWWSLPSWRRAAVELRQSKAIADCFHNLAAFSVHDFDRFDETRFWQDIEHLGKVHGAGLTERYRRIFDEYIAGRAAYTC